MSLTLGLSTKISVGGRRGSSPQHYGGGGGAVLCEENQGGAVGGILKEKWEHKARGRNLRDWGRRGWGKQAPPPPRLLLPPQCTFSTVWWRQVREELLRPVRGAGGSWDWGWV